MVRSWLSSMSVALTAVIYLNVDFISDNIKGNYIYSRSFNLTAPINDNASGAIALTVDAGCYRRNIYQCRSHAICWRACRHLFQQQQAMQRYGINFQRRRGVQ